MRERERIVRYDARARMPAPEPLSQAFKDLDDGEIERRAATDPDAGLVPQGFWDGARIEDAGTTEQITLKLDTDVLWHFKSEGKGYRARINAVLRHYVLAQRKAR